MRNYFECKVYKAGNLKEYKTILIPALTNEEIGIRSILANYSYLDNIIQLF